MGCQKAKSDADKGVGRSHAQGEREERLSRMCQQNNIEIRRRENIENEKRDAFWVVEKRNLL
jgi:hypothetical protein